MESIEQINQWFMNQIHSSGFWWQLMYAVSTLVISWLLAAVYNRRTQPHINSTALHSLKGASLRLLERLVFPTTATILMFIGSEIFTALFQHGEVLFTLSSLMIAMMLIRTVVFMLRLGINTRQQTRKLETVISSIIWAVVAMDLLGWLDTVKSLLDRPALELSENRVSLLNVLELGIAAGLSILIALIVAKVIERNVMRSSFIGPSLKISTVKLSRMVLVIFALIMALQAAGIKLTALTVFGGALGVGLGFGLQRIASNFISGFILVLDRSIKPGDVISIGTSFGWVQELRARYIVVKDRDNVERLIPNENLITSEVINWSYSDTTVRQKLPVQVSYKSDPEKVLKLMEQAAQGIKRVLSEPAPAARLVSFGDNGINMELRLWISDPQNGVTNVRSDVNLAMWKLFKENDIEIPYPQRVVHLDKSPGDPANMGAVSGD